MPFPCSALDTFPADWISWISENGLLNCQDLTQSNLLWTYMGGCSFLSFKDHTASIASRVYLNLGANGFY
jgi:hypothetical protein